jgi:hypothetical protein
MKFLWKNYFYLITIIIISTIGCGQKPTAVVAEPQLPYSQFEFFMKYWTYGRNNINTFDNTLTRDLVCDGRDTTINFTLTTEEKIDIYNKVLEIDFFNIQDTISQQCGYITEKIDTSSTDSIPFIPTFCMTVTPSSPLFIDVQLDSLRHSVFITEVSLLKDSIDASKVIELQDLIIEQINNHTEELEQIPKPGCLYY